MIPSSAASTLFQCASILLPHSKEAFDLIFLKLREYFNVSTSISSMRGFFRRQNIAAHEVKYFSGLREWASAEVEAGTATMRLSAILFT
jgi:hypothetical protein